ncbi:UNKNOWN [Stylonychia lemnae]|uniref:Uncharacterized protein n=1 Tax=Stylonychia lemnae TaxID=5949 RepID=A0A078AFK3_STYLE|nr:UNKNOWN [Stylonychia lemnae]|eukprot:CDW80292.1 UNKNOWN [Stylonychia lemnae]
MAKRPLDSGQQTLQHTSFHSIETSNTPMRRLLPQQQNSVNYRNHDFIFYAENQKKLVQFKIFKDHIKIIDHQDFRNIESYLINDKMQANYNEQNGEITLQQPKPHQFVLFFKVLSEQQKNYKTLITRSNNDAELSVRTGHYMMIQFPLKKKGRYEKFCLYTKRAEIVNQQLKAQDLYFSRIKTSGMQTKIPLASVKAMNLSITQSNSILPNQYQFKLKLTLKKNKIFAMIHQDFNVIKKFVHFIQHQTCFMHQHTPAEQLSQRENYITKSKQLKLNFKQVCLELRQQGFLKPKLDRLLNELRPNNVFSQEQNSKEDFSLSLQQCQEESDKYQSNNAEEYVTENNSVILNESDIMKNNNIQFNEIKTRNFCFKSRSNQNLKNYNKQSPVRCSRKLSVQEDTELTHHESRFQNFKMQFQPSDGDSKSLFGMSEQSPSAVKHLDQKMFKHSYLSQNKDLNQASSIRLYNMSKLQVSGARNHSGIIDFPRFQNKNHQKLIELTKSPQNKFNFIQGKENILDLRRQQRSQQEIHIIQERETRLISPEEQLRTVDNNINYNKISTQKASFVYQEKKFMNKTQKGVSKKQSELSIQNPLQMTAELENDLNILGQYTQNGCLTNRNERKNAKIIKNNAINNIAFLSPLHALHKQDSALTEKQDSKMFGKYRESTQENHSFTINGQIGQTIQNKQHDNITFPSSISTLDRKEQRKMIQNIQESKEFEMSEQDQYNDCFSERLNREISIKDQRMTYEELEEEKKPPHPSIVFQEKRNVLSLIPQKKNSVNYTNSIKLHNASTFQGVQSNETQGATFMATATFDNKEFQPSIRHKQERSMPAKYQPPSSCSVVTPTYRAYQHDYTTSGSIIELNVLQSSQIDQTAFKSTNRPNNAQSSLSQNHITNLQNYQTSTKQIQQRRSPQHSNTHQKLFQSLIAHKQNTRNHQDILCNTNDNKVDTSNFLMDSNLNKTNQSLMTSLLKAQIKRTELQSQKLISEMTEVANLKDNYETNLKKQANQYQIYQENENRYIEEIEDLKRQLLLKDKQLEEKSRYEENYHKLKARYDHLVRLVKDICPELLRQNQARFIREGGISMNDLQRLIYSTFKDHLNNDQANSNSNNSENESIFSNLNFNLGNLNLSQYILRNI